MAVVDGGLTPPRATPQRRSETVEDGRRRSITNRQSPICHLQSRGHRAFVALATVGSPSRGLTRGYDRAVLPCAKARARLRPVNEPHRVLKDAAAVLSFRTRPVGAEPGFQARDARHEPQAEVQMISDCRFTIADWRFGSGSDLQSPIADLKSAINKPSSFVPVRLRPSSIVLL